MYLEKAKIILDEEYQKQKALADDAGLILIEEKIVHSYQVLGAGNMILRNEEVYKKCSKKERDLLQSAVLLHDLGRFQEGVTPNIDHGIHGANLLKEFDDFKLDKVYLAVKHHGHMIEALYDDDEYKVLSDAEKEEVKKYIFLVRDADKIANFYLLIRNFQKMDDLFFHPGRFDGTIKASDYVHKTYMEHKSINKKDVMNVTDQTLMVMACVYDLNYKASFRFLDKMNIMGVLFDFCAKYFDEEYFETYKREILNFIKERV